MAFGADDANLVLDAIAADDVRMWGHSTAYAAGRTCLAYTFAYTSGLDLPAHLGTPDSMQTVNPAWIGMEAE